MSFTEKEKNIGKYIDVCVFLFVYIIVAVLLLFVVNLFGSINLISESLIGFISLYVAYLSIQGEPVETIEAFRGRKD